jgi:hypothetical protein
MALAVQPAVSLAGGRPRNFRNHTEADIESLSGSLQYVRGNWQLGVRYDVEVEDANRRDRFNLAMTVLERGRPLLDRWGRPVTIVVPLDRPTKIERDEITFNRQATIRLPDGSIGNPKQLRLVAKVIRADNGRVLDQEEESIKFRQGPRRPRVGWPVASAPNWFRR